MAFDAFAAMMRAEQLPELAITAFRLHYEQLIAGATGIIPEEEIRPVTDVPDAETLRPELTGAGRAHLHQAVILKLNGGLGTSMGLDQAKSLLPVKHGKRFLELIALQARTAGCPLVLMNSFTTRADSLACLAELPPLPGEGTVPLDFIQHKVPKVDQATLAPVSWPVEHQRWCPPGHGDLFTALVTRGALAALRAAGKRYAFLSNSDNLGATLDLQILGYVVQNRLPFLMEVTERAPADAKGGHVAERAARPGETGPPGLLLRETAQCRPEDVHAFQDVTRHRYFNTNNLWIDLVALERLLEANEGVLSLPLIRNAKTVDPRDPDSTPVYQLESAMGAAIARFEGAAALRVPRSRFSPVKTTADLLRVRSDATRLTDDGCVLPTTALPPVVELDPAHYRLVGQLDARFPHGPPSLSACTELRVEGDWTFGAGVVCRGRVHLQSATPQRVPDGAVLVGPDE